MFTTRRKLAPCVLAVALIGVAALAACRESGNEPADTVELSFAHSYSTEHPHHTCGAQVVADELAAGDSGITIEIFPNSQLGPDGPDRVSAVAAGDISIDIQGSSAISALYEPIGALDAAYVFDGPDHLFAFADSPAFDEMAEDMLAEIGVRILDVWYFGMRHFSANTPIRTPDDLEGLRMRFPDSPQFLQNAEALGANATPVAFEEVYLSLQQGVIDGQENPIPTIEDMNFAEVQDYVSLSGHQTGFVVAIIGEQTWQSLSAEQQDALQAAVSGAREGNRQCLEDAEQEVLDKWRQEGRPTIVEDVDRAAFTAKAEVYFEEHLEGDKLDLYRQIREIAPQ
ncbi:MAG TPA: sialic acid TRAP transporter substrate-binding protein SiaP [Natronosporangium sp.]